MRGLIILGAVLVMVGIAGLFVGGVSFTEKDTVLKAGPFEVTAEEQHSVSVPTIAGVIVALIGGGLIIVGMRRSRA